MKALRIFFLILPALVLSSCFDDAGTDIVFGDTAYLEIDRAGQPNPVVTLSFEKNPDGGTDPVTVSVQVNIMGKPQSKDIVANFEIVDGTAVQGFHYDLVTSGTSITIPAGQSSASIQFEVFPDAFDPDNDTEPWTVGFKLTGGDLELSQYVEVNYNLSGKCAFDRDFFTGDYHCNEPGYANYPVSLSADPDDENSVINDNFWDVGAEVKYKLNPATDVVTIPLVEVPDEDPVPQEFIANIGRGPETLTVTGTGTYNSCTGQMIVKYNVKTKADNLGVDSNTHTFNKD